MAVSPPAPGETANPIRAMRSCARLAFAALLSLCLAPSFAQDRGERGAHKQPAQQEQRGTESQPLVIKLAPSPDTETRADEDKRERDEKRESDKKIEKYTDDLARFTGDLAAYTGALVIVGIIQAAIFIAQFIFIWRQEVSAHRIERAYVFADVEAMEEPVHTPSGQTPWNLNVDFFNSGKTPAIVRKIRGYPILRGEADHPTALMEHPDAEREITPSIAIAGETGYSPYRESPMTVRISDAEWAQIERGDLVLFVVGRLEYDDIFGKRHESGHCWRYVWHMQRGRFIPDRDSPLNYYT